MKTGKSIVKVCPNKAKALAFVVPILFGCEIKTKNENYGIVSQGLEEMELSEEFMNLETKNSVSDSFAARNGFTLSIERLSNDYAIEI